MTSLPRRSVPGPHGEAALTLLVVIVFLTTFSVARVAGEENAAQASPERRPARPWNGAFRAGVLTLDPQVRIDTDWRMWQGAEDRGQNHAPELAGKRVGVDGAVGKRLSFELSAELTSSSPWRDVRAQYELLDAVTITGGQFKVPLGLDGTRSAADRDFVLRSRLADAFSMGRDQGVSIETKFWRKRATIETGFFSGGGGASTGDGGRTIRASQVIAGTGTTTMLRATVAPMSKGRTVFRDLRLGVSAASGELREGRSPLVLRSVSDEDVTAPTYWVRGSRTHRGVDARWRSGPFSAAVEYLAVSDERRGQGNRNEDLTPLRGGAWYAEGTWLLTGEKKVKDLRPRRALRDGGLGAFEVAVRSGTAWIGTRGVLSALAASPRADRPAHSETAAHTAGINWYPAAGARVQFNVTRETLTGATSKRLQGLSHVFSTALRLQLFL